LKEEKKGKKKKIIFFILCLCLCLGLGLGSCLFFPFPFPFGRINRASLVRKKGDEPVKSLILFKGLLIRGSSV